MSLLFALVAFAWVAIVLLGLATGGLLARVRNLESQMAGQGRSLRPSVVPRFNSDSLPVLPDGHLSVLFVNSECNICHLAVSQLLPRISDQPLAIATDRELDGLEPLPTNVRVIVDAGAIQRSNVPAVPWFAAVNASGDTVASFPLGGPQSVDRAVHAMKELA